MPLVEIRTEGWDALEAKFKILADNIEDMSQPIEEIGNYLRSVIIEQYATEGARSGFPWQELSLDYAEWKSEHLGFVHPLLLGAESAAGYGLAQAVEETDVLVTGDDSGQVTINNEKAVYHQHGRAPGGRGGAMPARPIVDLVPSDYRAVDRIAAEWVAHEVGLVFESGSRGSLFRDPITGRFTGL